VRVSSASSTVTSRDQCTIAYSLIVLSCLLGMVPVISYRVVVGPYGTGGVLRTIMLVEEDYRNCGQL
jgi:hypothetical protein